MQHDVGGYPAGVERDTRAGYKSLRTARVLEVSFEIDSPCTPHELDGTGPSIAQLVDECLTVLGQLWRIARLIVEPPYVLDLRQC